MDQQTADHWHHGFKPSPGSMAIDHLMTINPAHLSKDFSCTDDDIISSARCLDYPNLDGLQHDFPMATIPDLVSEAQGQDTNMSNMPAFLSYQECLNDPIEGIIDTSQTARLRPSTFQQFDAQLYDNETSTPKTAVQALHRNCNIADNHTSKVSEGSQQFQALQNYQLPLLAWTMSEIGGQDVTTPLTKTPKAPGQSKSSRRKDKAKYRRSISRVPSPPASPSPRKSGMPQHTSNSSDTIETASSQQIDVPLDFETFNPTSTLAQRKKTYLMKQMKALADQQAELERQMRELMIDDEMFGGLSDNEKADQLERIASSSSSKSFIPNSEDLDSDDTADRTSISSTSRLAVPLTRNTLTQAEAPFTIGKRSRDGTLKPQAASAEPSPRKHDNCVDCGFKTLYHCTYRGCGHATHSFADYKRHESGDTHWPQNRFLCLKCIPHVSDENGNKVCGFCNLLTDNIEQHSLLCMFARNNGLTFGRADHLIEHLRKYHPVEDNSKARQKETNKEAATWKYPIDSKWPRQCGFCGFIFQTWEERMKHMAQHFQAGLTMRNCKLPFLPPKDFEPGPSFSFKKYDDNDDNDNSPSTGRGGPRLGSSGQHGESKASGQSKESQSRGSRGHQGQRTRYSQQDQHKDCTSNIEALLRPGQRCKMSLRFPESFSTDSERHRVPRPLALQRYLDDPYEPVLSWFNLGSEPTTIDTSRGKGMTAWKRDFISTDERAIHQFSLDYSVFQIGTTTSGSTSKGMPSRYVTRETFRSQRHTSRQHLQAALGLLKAYIGIITRRAITSRQNLSCTLSTCQHEFDPSSTISWFAHCLSHPMVHSAFLEILRGSTVSPEETSTIKSNVDLTRRPVVIHVAMSFQTVVTRLDRGISSPSPTFFKAQHWRAQCLQRRSMGYIGKSKKKPPISVWTQRSSLQARLSTKSKDTDKELPYSQIFLKTQEAIVIGKEEVQFQQVFAIALDLGHSNLLKKFMCSMSALRQEDKTKVLANILDGYINIANGINFLHQELHNHWETRFRSHLDLKPANFILKSRSVMKISDFWVSRIGNSGTLAKKSTHIRTRIPRFSSAPMLFACSGEPYSYRLKGMSNLKQHMRRAHGWACVQSKDRSPPPLIAGTGFDSATLRRVDAFHETSGDRNGASDKLNATVFDGEKVTRNSPDEISRMLLLQDSSEFQVQHLHDHPERTFFETNLVPPSHVESLHHASYDQRCDKFGRAIERAIEVVPEKLVPAQDGNLRRFREKIERRLSDEDSFKASHNCSRRYSDAKYPSSPATVGEVYPISPTSTMGSPSAGDTPKVLFSSLGATGKSTLVGLMTSRRYKVERSQPSELDGAECFNYDFSMEYPIPNISTPGNFQFPTMSSTFVDLAVIYPEYSSSSSIKTPSSSHESSHPVSPFFPSKGWFSNETSQSPYICYDFPSRRPSLASHPGTSYYHFSESIEGRCTHPGCGKMLKDLKAHMLTHRLDRPEKCPITSCDYHTKGFARKYDKNRHTLSHYRGNTVCGFCPDTGSAAKKSFNRADVFRRHLISVHGVEQTSPNSRRKSATSNLVVGTSGKVRQFAECDTRLAKCSTCSAVFSDPQRLYDHLDDCVLKIFQHETPKMNMNMTTSLQHPANSPSHTERLRSDNLMQPDYVRRRPTGTFQAPESPRYDDDTMCLDSSKTPGSERLAAPTELQNFSKLMIDIHYESTPKGGVRSDLQSTVDKESIRSPKTPEIEIEIMKDKMPRTKKKSQQPKDQARQDVQTSESCSKYPSKQLASLAQNESDYGVLGVNFVTIQVNAYQAPRLGRNEVAILEASFKEDPKPNTQTKRVYAETMHVDLSRINNWFQNRRAKQKQEKKQAAFEPTKNDTDELEQEQRLKAMQTTAGPPFYPRVPEAAFSRASESLSDSLRLAHEGAEFMQPPDYDPRYPGLGALRFESSTDAYSSSLHSKRSGELERRAEEETHRDISLMA